MPCFLSQTTFESVHFYPYLNIYKTVVKFHLVMSILDMLSIGISSIFATNEWSISLFSINIFLKIMSSFCKDFLQQLHGISTSKPFVNDCRAGACSRLNLQSTFNHVSRPNQTLHKTVPQTQVFPLLHINVPYHRKNSCENKPFRFCAPPM